MTRVNREDLLQSLISVQPGLSPKEVVEQSSCYVFKDGKVMTFNDEVACVRDVALNITGAVSAEPLYSLLDKLKEDDIDVSIGHGELIIAGKNKKAGVRLEKEISLPIASVEMPKKWHKLPEDFANAVDLVHQCASTDESMFNMTCVHIHPDWIEACDNEQLTRYKIATGVTEPSLVKHTAIKHIIAVGMTKFAETESWLHFKNRAGLILSCRKYLETFPELDAFLKVKGSPVTLPKGLAEATQKAEVFLSENSDYDKVSIKLVPGKLRLRGLGSLGWYMEVKKVAYKGDEIAFNISPKLLIELTQKHNDVMLTKDRLAVKGTNWSYVTALEAPRKGKKSEKRAKAKDNGEESE